MIATRASARPLLRIALLAAGRSARLGRPKALARIRGRSLAARMLTLLEGLSPESVLLIVPPRASRLQLEARGARVRIVENPMPQCGLSGSVRRALRAARPAAALLLLPVDLALLERADLERLIRRWQGGRRRLVARRLGADGAGGTPLILPRWLWGTAAALSGDRGFKDLVPRLAPAARVLLELPSAALDVDTPADLQRARRRARA